MNAYELKTENFAGPIEKLLELIEEKELDVTTVSLSKVTADFLVYLETLSRPENSAVNPQILADFISVASKLILIKSKALLPQMELTEEEESDIKDLENRLRIYAKFKAVRKNIETLWNANRVAYGRELFGSYKISFFYPSPDLTISSIQKSMSAVFQVIEAMKAKERKMVQRAIVSIEEKIKELVARLKAKGRSHFSELASTREEMVVLFLAILHLLKDRLVDIEQTENFSDIIIKHKSQS